MNAGDDLLRARIAERIAAVRTRFLANLGERTRELSTLARRAAAPDRAEASSARDALRRGLHNIAGAAPTLGLAALGRKASQLEAKVVSAAGEGLETEVAEQLAADIAALAAIQT